MPDSTFDLLKRHQLQPKKQLGQNFLIDPNHQEKILAVAQLEPTSIVLEIGPGLGAITGPMLKQAKAVLAVETDSAMVQVLQSELGDQPNFWLEKADILTITPADLLAQHLPNFTPGQAFVVVANLPYYITSAVIRHLLEQSHPPRRIVITIQKEVAQRIMAQPGNLSLLAISVQFYGQPTLHHVIPRKAFYPAPKVDSAVLSIDLYGEQPLPISQPNRYFEVVKAGFSQKRKQLKNALAGGLGRQTTTITPLIEQAGLDPRRRAETLTLAEWAALTLVIFPDAGGPPSNRLVKS